MAVCPQCGKEVRRLAQHQARVHAPAKDASVPSNQSASPPPDLQAVLGTLVREIQAIRQENSTLRAELAAVQENVGSNMRDIPQVVDLMLQQRLDQGSAGVQAAAAAATSDGGQAKGSMGQLLIPLLLKGITENQQQPTSQLESLLSSLATLRKFEQAIAEPQMSAMQAGAKMFSDMMVVALRAGADPVETAAAIGRVMTPPVKAETPSE